MSKEILYSLGVVAEDIKEDDDIIKVFPIERLTGVDNKPLNHEEKETIVVETDEGSESINIVNTNYIKATWRSKYNYNRLTPPTVRAGEQVELFRYSNSDIYFWDTSNNDHTLRKEEKVIFGWSAKDNVNKEEPISDLHTLTIDTFKKFFQFLTTALFKEKTIYDVKFDLANGLFHFLDGNGNFFKLDTPEDTVDLNVNKDINIVNGNNVTIKNGNDVIIENANNITIKNGNDIKIENDNNIELTNGSNVKIKNGGNIDLDNEGNLDIKNGGTVNIDSSGSVTVKSPTVTIDTPKAIITGNTSIGGTLKVSGATTMTTVNTGALSASALTASGVITEGGKPLSAKYKKK